MNERRMQILKEFSTNYKISVADLATQFGVSQVTIRNDLKHLEENGLVKRIHGGASTANEEIIDNRLNVNYQIKLNIAQRAADMVSNGETIFIESGSTNALLAKKLGETKDVTIITNSCFIANFVKDLPRLNLILLGGNYQSSSEVCVGPLTCQSLAAFYVDKLFIGTDGYSESGGFTCINLLRAEVVSTMAKHAANTIVLTDSTKFSQRGVAQQVDLSQVSMVITDSSIPAPVEYTLKSHHITLITV